MMPIFPLVSSDALAVPPWRDHAVNCASLPIKQFDVETLSNMPAVLANKAQRPDPCPFLGRVIRDQAADQHSVIRPFSIAELLQPQG